MGVDLLKGISIFVILLLLQVLIFNHIHLFGFATPLLYVYSMLLFRRNFPKWGILVCGLVFLYCLIFFSLEAFNFFNWLQWLKCVGGSTVLTLILLMTIENVRRG